MPAHADGSASDMQNYVSQFIDTLAVYELEIDTVDERFTSVEAEAQLKDSRAAGTRGRITKESIDSAAAVLIAERYLAAHKI
jgi:RNase H-fold protein (predicted Holliday junction resolvase)